MELNLSSLNSKIFNTIGKHYISYQNGVLSQDEINGLLVDAEPPVIAPNQRFKVEVMYKPFIPSGQRFRVEKE